MPHCNSEALDMYLAEISSQVALSAQAVLRLDQPCRIMTIGLRNWAHRFRSTSLGIGGGQTGLLSAAGDVAALADNLLRAANDENQMKELGLAGLCELYGQSHREMHASWVKNSGRS